MKRIAFAVCILASCAPGEAIVDDSASITGTISDAETNELLAGAIIDTTPPTGRITADQAGVFVIDQGTKIGVTYEVTAAADGFEPKTSTIKLVQGVNTLDFALELLRICAPGTTRCAQGGPESIETCATRGNLWNSAPCGANEVCDDSGEVARCARSNELTVSSDGAGGGFIVSSPSGINCEPTCTRSFPEGARVTLTANPFALSVFAGWTGDCAGMEPTCTVVLDRARNVSARFDTTGFLLTITRDGRGRVLSEPMGINCGAMCQLGWPMGTPLLLRALPQTNAQFSGWSGDGCSGTTPTCMITMDRDRNIRAAFETQQFALDVQKMGMGAGVVTSDPGGIDCGSTCNASFDIDTVVTLDAQPNGSSTFAGWGGDCTGTGPCTVTMSAAHNVTATFDGISHRVDVMKTGAGLGTITSAPSGIDCGADCNETFGQGQVLTLTAVEGAGSTFGGWSGACAASGMSPTCMVTVDTPLMIGAQFDVGSYDVTVNVSGSGAVASNPAGISCPADCTQSFAGGTPVTFTATPNPGFNFASWGDACMGVTGTTCMRTINAATTVSATFLPFYLFRLPVDANCTTLLHFDAGMILTQFCGGGAPATTSGMFTPVGSRSTPLAGAISSAGDTSEEAWIDLMKPGPVPPDATIEMTIQKVGAAFGGRARGMLYSNRDTNDPNGAGVRVYVTNDGRFGVETSNGTASQVAETAAGTIADLSWYHVAATLSSSTGIALFVDAAAAGSFTGVIPFAASSSTAWAGAEREGPGGAIERFNGIVDEIRVSNVRRY